MIERFISPESRPEEDFQRERRDESTDGMAGIVGGSLDEIVGVEGKLSALIGNWGEAGSFGTEGKVALGGSLLP